MKRWLLAALGAAWMGVCAPGCGTPEDEEVPTLSDDGKADQAASDGRVYHFRRDDTGTPRTIRVDEAAPVEARAIPVDAARVALAFLRRNAALLRIDPEKLGPAQADGGVIDFDQRIDGRRLFGATIRVVLDPGGRIALVHNRFVQHPIPSGRVPRLSADAARVAAKLPGAEAELGWMLDASDRAIPVWQLEGDSTRAVIAADDGRSLVTEDLRRDVAGRGRVYPQNPVTTPDLVEADLVDLAPDGSLADDNVEVVSAHAVDAQSMHWVLDFMPGSDGFGQVMAYHHVDSVARWLQAQNLSPRRKPIAVRPRAFRELNAYFDPKADGIFLGYTSAFDAADDAGVMVHEFGHSVVHGYAPGLLGRRYAAGDAAIHEGYADYLACTYFDDPMSAEALHLALWKQGDAGTYLTQIDFDPRHPGRACDSLHKWPRDVADDPHVTGMIVSASLWDLRQALARQHGKTAGAKLADQIAIGGIKHFARSNNDFTDVLHALLEADRRLGGHEATAIQASFARHGVLPTSELDLRRGPPWLP